MPEKEGTCPWRSWTVLTENRVVLTIVKLIDLGLAASFDRVHPYILILMMLNPLLVGLRGHAAMPDPKCQYPIYETAERMRFRLPDVILAEHRSPRPELKS